MMAMGAALVADDRTELFAESGVVIARSPDAIAGLIEARGVGILKADHVETAKVVAVLDLDQTETERLPPNRDTELLGQRVPLYYTSKYPALPAAMVQLLKLGRHA